MDKHIVPASDDGVGNISIPPHRRHRSRTHTTSDGWGNGQAVEHGRIGSSGGASSQQSPRNARNTPQIGIMSPAGKTPLNGPQESDEITDLSPIEAKRAAHACPGGVSYWLKGHVAKLVRVLDADGHPVTSREEAVRLELLPEWEHLGQLCVCRDVLPPMPHWLPQSQATQLLADAEARCPGSSILQLIGVEFADGFVTALERDELSILPLKAADPGDGRI